MPSGILLSFGHALRGLVEVTARERNMKLHVLSGTAVGLLGAEVALPLPSRLALLFAVMLVVGAEMGNSALEALVDLHTRELREEARRAKDAAAGGVLVLALGAVLLAVAIAVANHDALRAALHRRGVELLLGGGVVVLEAFLLFRRTSSAALDGIAIVVGALLVAFLGLNGLPGSLSLSLVAALLFALASASALSPRARQPA
jgi:diacylglycerol kinase (ATP)